MSENVKLKEIKEFSLGSGSLYVASGRVSEWELEDENYRVGETDGACILRYEYKLRELFDIDGNSAAMLRYGEKARIKGKLRRIFGTALPVILGDGGIFGKDGRLSVLLVCPLPDGDSFRLYLNGAVTGSTAFSITEGGGLEFELLCGKGVEHPAFRLKGDGRCAS